MSQALPGSTFLRVVVIGTTTLGLVIAITLAAPSTVILFASFAGIGAYLAIRRPTNPIGWLLIAMGWGLAIGSPTVTTPLPALLAGALSPLDALAAWGNDWGWNLAMVGLFGVTLVFPSGELPGGRGRVWSQVAIVAMLGLMLALMFGPTISIILEPSRASVDIPNPLALAPDAPLWRAVPDTVTLYAMSFLICALSVIALLARYRRSVGGERLQYRWLVAALAFVVIATSIWAFATQFLQFASDGPVWILVFLAYPTVPIAIGIAVLRYRLYEIDRIISRTISYVAVTALLAGVFGTAIVLLSTGLASFAEGETIAVAGSTLVAFAAFQPALRRVRRTVDRRFDRTGYDAERTAVAFADRLRFETDVETVTSDLAATTRVAVAPASMGLWLRPRDQAR